MPSYQKLFSQVFSVVSDILHLNCEEETEIFFLYILTETMAGSISLDTTLALLQTSAAEKDSASEVSYETWEI